MHFQEKFEESYDPLKDKKKNVLRQFNTNFFISTGSKKKNWFQISTCAKLSIIGAMKKTVQYKIVQFKINKLEFKKKVFWDAI